MESVYTVTIGNQDYCFVLQDGKVINDFDPIRLFNEVKITFDALKNKLDEANAKLDEANAKIESMEKESSAKTKEVNELKSKVNEFESQHTDLSNKVYWYEEVVGDCAYKFYDLQRQLQMYENQERAETDVKADVETVEVATETDVETDVETGVEEEAGEEPVGPTDSTVFVDVMRKFASYL